MKAKESGESRQRKIEIAAYHLAERRHFAPGHEVADWLAAEASVAHDDAVVPTAPPAVAAPAAPPAPKAKPAKAPKPGVATTAKPLDAAVPVQATKTPKSRTKRPPAGTSGT